tara:strand:- start:497 stop:1006 length:510 start_codon:yes stop_codon:yes gene_type:complete
MSKFANPKNAWGISDRSGFRYRLGDMRKEWTGFMVGKDEFEVKHPQLDPTRKKADLESLRNSRPSRSEPVVSVLLRVNPFTTGTSGQSSTTITVQEHSHGRTVSSQVRFRNVAPFDGISSSVMELAIGYAIASVVDTDNYTVTVSATATTGSIKGGGKIASAGPVTLEN